MVQHSGGCHCGAVSFTFEAPAEMAMTDCNCSICTMTGFQHVFIPQGDMTVNGMDNITSYTFGTGQAKHMFCKSCGVKSFYIPKSHPDCFSVNYRCIAPGTLEISKIIPFDGQNWEKNIEGLREQS